MKRVLIILIIMIAVGSVLFFGSNFFIPKRSSSGRLQVTTSFYPLYFFTREIAGDKADVYNITPAGAEPHDYELTTLDLARIEDSNLLVLNGKRLESWGEKIKDVLSGTDTKVITVGEIGQIANDPHVWLDPVLAKSEVEAIKNGLVLVDSANASYYESNAANLTARLENLDVEFRNGLLSCKKKDFITTHAAFGYLAGEYGLTQTAISGLSPDEEPSAEKLAGVADFARKNQVKYIFFENLLSPKLAETIALESGARTLALNPLEGLSDGEIKNGKNYFSEMKKNLANLKTALVCR